MNWLTKYHDRSQFSDPFMLPSSQAMPTTFGPDLFDFCAYLYYLNPMYKRASERVISHFITDVEFVGKSGDRSEQKELAEYYKDQLRLYDFLNELGNEWSAYGNGFAWIYEPFNRFLVDYRGGTMREYALGIFGNNITFKIAELAYEVDDPLTMHLPEGKRQRITLKFRDRKSTDMNRIFLAKIDPRYVIPRYNKLSGATDYIWRFDAEFLADVKAGQLHIVNDTPVAMLEAIKDDNDFLFGPDQIFHLKAPTISGISNNGYGLPEVLANYRSLHILQVYRKIDEAVGLDYMLPFRIFSPQVSPEKIGDGTQMTLMSVWQRNIKDLIVRRREDPFAIHAMPLPVNLQELGVNGKELSPKDLVEYQTNDMLTGAGYPAELFRGSLTIQQIPTALRLFENQFHFLYRGNDRFVKWVTRRILDYTNANQQGVRLLRPSTADDLERRNIYMQLVAGGEVPRRVGYDLIGINDPVDAAAQRAREDIDIAKVQQQLQGEFQREQTQGSLADQVAQEAAGAPQDGGGGASDPGAGGGAAGGTPTGVGLTPLDMDNQAQQLAQDMLKIPSDGDRAKQLRQLEGGNPQLYAVVMDKMKKMRSQAASQGKAQLGQQLQQPQGGQPQQ